jgi:hypothetical protein
MNLLQQAGATPERQPRYVPLFMDRAFTGLFTQRSVLHDPSDVVTSKFYGGRPDAIWMGSNVELTNRLTLQRRPGLSPFSTATYPGPPNRAFAFELTNGTIQVIIDTGSSGSFVLTSVGNSTGGQAVYTGTITGGASNAFVGLNFNVTGFAGPTNNGSFMVIASSATQLTLSNAQAVAETHAAAAISLGGGVYYDQQNGSKTLLFAKSPNAGQTYFVGVAGVLYMGDGVETHVYTPGNPNGTVWNLGIAAPTNPPTVTITPSGSSATAWQASTAFTTMGLLVDSVGNVEQLISVNANGTNPSSRFGTAGAGGPPWQQTPGQTTADGGITWTNFGPVSNWAGNTRYNNFSVGGTLVNPAFVYDATTNAVYGNSNAASAAGISGTTRPPFVNVIGAFTNDNGGNNGTGIKWVCVGLPLAWQASHHYIQYATAGGDSPNGIIVEPSALPPSSTQTTYIQVSGNTATSGTGGTNPPWPTVLGTSGVTTDDGQLRWMSLGSATRVINTAYTAWVAGATTFSVIEVSGGMYVCTMSGNSSSTATGALTWPTVYGSTLQDGGVQWTCVGSAMSWVPSLVWFLPIGGFAPPESSQSYGGAEIVEAGVVQTVINSGISGGSAPAWSGLGLTTTDNTVVWYAVSVQSTNSLSWTKGYVYAYSFKARSLTDPYSPLPLGGGLIPPPLGPPLSPGGPPTGNSLGPPTGSETGAISTASPVFTIVGGNAGAVNTISGLGSTDPQVDTIVIWRSADGGNSATMFELTEIPAPKPIGGVAQPWSFQDFLPDVPIGFNPGLNELIPAPIDESNDPPNSAFLPMIYNYSRIWGAVGNTVFFSGGPDVLAGNPNTAYNPADDLPFLANVTRLVRTSQGSVVFLTEGIEMIAGGPTTASFFSVTLAQGIGLLNYNALDVYAGEIYFVSSDSQIMTLNPSLNIQSYGFPIGDKIAQFNAAIAQLAVQQSGVDNGIYVADGTTGWYRCNPHQVPGGANGPEAIWSPFANITNGCQMVQSVEVSPGIKKLLVGSTTANQQILERNLSVFTDNGTPYDAYFVMGSIMLAHPGQLAVLKFIEMDMSGVAYQPTISYLLNEISGTFTPFMAAPQFDPPSLYGTTLAPTSYSPNRYFFSGTGSLARCRHLQLKVDFGSTSNGDEIFNVCIFGRLLVEL